MKPAQRLYSAMPDDDSPLPLKTRDQYDRVPDADSDDEPTPYENTYADGSLQNECWKSTRPAPRSSSTKSRG